ncbi:MAG: universal stress protein [Planctomycetota bacterium]
MKDFASILVGIDFRPSDGTLTEGARSATLQAIELAKENGARLKFLYSEVRDPEEERGSAFDLAVGQAGWRALCAEHGLADPELVISEEAPWLAMTHRVLSGGYDLVIVGKRNRGRAMDRQLGSVTMRLLRKCPGPVWVVRPGHEEDAGPFLAATDLSTVGNRAVERAARLAQADDADLVIVHAWQIPFELQLSGSRMGDEEYQARTQEAVESARAEIRAIPGVADLGERAKILIALGAASEAILKVERRIEPCLTVLGSAARGGIPGFLMGNTAERLLYQLESSLLVVKPEDFVSPVG